MGKAGGTAKLFQSAACAVDAHCIGERWVALNEQDIAKMVALIAMGQAVQAAAIIEALAALAPAVTTDALIDEAIIKLTVQEKKTVPRKGYPKSQRDGFIFEAISWIVARETYGGAVFLKDPHVSATAQGLDGLMIELDPAKSQIIKTTIFEDKCTEDPEGTFAKKVVPAFRERHANKRDAEIIATATTLLQIAQVPMANAPKLAAAVTDLNLRRYRASLVITTDEDTDAGRKKIFADYSKISGLTPDQRIAASFVVPPKLRDWFEQLALMSRAYLESFRSGKSV